MMKFYVPNHDGIFCFLEQISFIFNRQIVLIKIYFKKDDVSGRHGAAKTDKNSDARCHYAR